MAFDWTSLLPKTGDFLGKAIGDTIAPSPDLQNVQNEKQKQQFDQSQTGFQNQLLLAKLAQQNSIRSQMAPGMYTNLGFTPEASKTMFKPLQLPASAPGATLGATGGGTYAPPASAPSSGLGSTAKAVGGAALGIPGIAGLAAKGLGAGLGAAGGAIGSGLSALSGGALGTLGGVTTSVGAAGLPATTTAASSGLLGGLGATGVGAIAAGAILAGIMWKKSQVHPTADKWVQSAQNPFDESMAKIDQQGLPPEQVQEAKKTNVQNYLTSLQNFSMKGSKERTVAQQSLNTFKQWYGDPAQYGITLSL